MTPPGSNVVAFDVARLAVDLETVKGEVALLASSVGQRMDVLSTGQNNMQHEQMLAREERLKQTALLTQLVERTAGIPDSALRMNSLERQVTLWRGIVIGLGFAITMGVYIYQTDKAALQTTVSANTAAIRALERAK